MNLILKYLIIFSCLSNALIVGLGDSNYQTQFWETSYIFSILSQNDLSRCNLFLLYETNGFEEFDLNILKIIENVHQTVEKDLITINYNDVKKGIYPRINSRFKKHCTISLIFFKDQDVSVKDERISRLLLNGYDAVTRAGVDFYILITKIELLNQLITSQLAQKLKFNIGLGFPNSIPNQVSKPLIKTLCPYCANGQPLIIHLNEDIDVFEDFYNNFYGYKIIMSAPTRLQGVVEIAQVKPSKWIMLRGPYKNVCEELAKFLNFTLITRASPGTGANLPNGTWTGIVGDVVSGKSHFGVVVGHILPRHKVVSWSYPILFEWLTFTTGKPKPYFSWASIAWPFTFDLWILVTILLILIVGTYCLFFWYKFKLDQTPEKSIPFGNIWGYVLGSILEEGVTDLNGSVTIKVFTIFWLFYSLLISTAYRSKLIGFLVSPNFIYPPKTFNELAESSSSWTWGMESGGINGAAWEIFKSSNNPTYKKIFKSMRKEPNIVNCFGLGVTSNFGCITWRVMSEYSIHKNFTNGGKIPLMIQPDSTSFLSVGWIMGLGCKFRTNFDKIATKVFDLGLYSKWMIMDFNFIREERRKWEASLTTRKKENRNFDENSPIVLGLVNSQGAFYLFILTSILSVLVFLGEICLNAHKYKIPTCTQNIHLENSIQLK